MKKWLSISLAFLFMWVMDLFCPQMICAQEYIEYLDPKVTVAADQSIPDIEAENIGIIYFVAPETKIYSFRLNRPLSIIMTEMETGRYISANNAYKFECNGGKVYTIMITNSGETAETGLLFSVKESDNLDLDIAEIFEGENTVEIAVDETLGLSPHLKFTPKTTAKYHFEFPYGIKTSILTPSNNVMKDLEDEAQVFIEYSGDPVTTPTPLEAGHTYYLYLMADWHLYDAVVKVTNLNGNAISDIKPTSEESQCYSIDGKIQELKNIQSNSIYVTKGKKLYQKAH